MESALPMRAGARSSRWVRVFRSASFAIAGLSLAGCFALFSLDGYGPPPEATESSPDGGGDALTAPVAVRIVFVTSDQVTGALGGVAGANTLCNDLASKAGLPGHYRAWISDKSSTPKDKFPALVDASGNGADPLGPPLAMPNGVIIANGFTELRTKGPRVPLVVNERDAAVEAIDKKGGCFDGGFVWTNTKENGAAAAAADTDCNQWNGAPGGWIPLPARGVAGVLGGDDSAERNWSSGCPDVSCSASGHLYCFQD
jgi:hypothetical protein